MATRYELVEDGRPGGAVRVVATGPGGKESCRTVAHLLRSSSGGPNAYRPGAREIVPYGGDDVRRKVLANVTTERGTGVMQEHWDPRLVAALVGIHQTFASLAITDSKDWYHR